MCSGLLKTGLISEEELKKCQLPSDERLKKGPVAVIECIQEIPCNPCEAACKYGAIKVGSPIINLPVLNEEKCIGCGQCIAMCPGLAIFLEDYTFSDEEAIVAIPYEYQYIPQKGHKVRVMSRAGEVIGTGVVEKVINSKNNDRTLVIYLRVPKLIARNVRNIDFRGGRLDE